jgi:hypothetical protein
MPSGERFNVRSAAKNSSRLDPTRKHAATDVAPNFLERARRFVLSRNRRMDNRTALTDLQSEKDLLERDAATLRQSLHELSSGRP